MWGGGGGGGWSGDGGGRGVKGQGGQKLGGGGVVEDYDIMVTVMTAAWISMLELTEIGDYTLWCSRRTKVMY